MVINMELTYWQSKEGDKSRIYVNGGFITEKNDSQKKLSIWFEKTASGCSFKVIGDYYHIASSSGALKASILMELGLSKNATWDELMSNVKKPTWNQYQKKNTATGLNRATESLNLSIESMQMVKPVSIYIDHREPKELILLLKRHPMITIIEGEGLELGDIVIQNEAGEKLIIERKRCSLNDKSISQTDFEVSIKDGRLFDQSERLKMLAAQDTSIICAIFLLEGDVYGNSGSLLCQNIDGALSFLTTIQSISVLPTYNLNHTAYVIAKLASHFVGGLYTPVTLHKSKPSVMFDSQHYIMESFPGISAGIAKLLIAKFGNIKNIINATKSELLEIPGMGPKKVEAFFKVING